MPTTSSRERVDEVLDIVDLARYRHRSPFNLSLGERRRLSVATMLVLEPRLLVLDEPTIGQDHERAQHLMRLMDRLRERYGTTILMITHDVRLVAEWADRAIALRRRRRSPSTARPRSCSRKPSLLKASALLPPPIFEVSAARWRKTHPDRVPGPTLVDRRPCPVDDRLKKERSCRVRPFFSSVPAIPSSIAPIR